MGWGYTPPGSGGGGGGATTHSELTGRDESDQHPISAITDLADALGGAPLIIDVYAGDDYNVVPGPEVSKNVVLRLLPATSGGDNQKIQLPFPTGSGQVISAVVGVNDEERDSNSYPGESVVYVGPTVIPATYATSTFDFLLSMSYPVVLDCSFDVVLQGIGESSPTVVPVVLDGTFADMGALGVAFVPQISAALAAHGFAFEVVPTGDHLGLFCTTAGVASVTIDDIVGSDDFTTGLAGETSTPGVDATLDDDEQTWGVLHSDGGTLGTELNGGTHTSPGNVDLHYKGWTVVDVALGVWSVLDWPDRFGMSHGSVLEPYLGPLGKDNDTWIAQLITDHIRAFLIPGPTQRTLVRASRSQVVNGLDKDRFVLFATALDVDDITFTLDDADGTQTDPSLPGVDYGCRSYELHFWRSPDDSSAQTVLVTDEGDFSETLAPGESMRVRSQIVGYVDDGLSPGTDSGELDDPPNQVYQWVRLVEAGSAWKENVVRSNTSGTSVAAGAAAGTSPTVNLVAGNDAVGAVGITVGTSPTTGILATVTFDTPYPGIALPIIMPSDPDAAAAAGVYALPVGVGPTTGFTIRATTALTAGTSYEWQYHVIGAPA